MKGVGKCGSKYLLCLAPKKVTLFETTERLAIARCIKRRTDGEGEGPLRLPVARLPWPLSLDLTEL